jgi:tRNA (guanine-N7-)-methyltransferase
MNPSINRYVSSLTMTCDMVRRTTVCNNAFTTETLAMKESTELEDGPRKEVADKHKRTTHTEDMKRCTFLIRGSKACKNRSSAESDVCQYHEPSRLAKERGLSVLTKRPRSSITDATEGDSSKLIKGCDEGLSVDSGGSTNMKLAVPKNEITRISGSQNRMYNPLATPLVDVGCIGLPSNSEWSNYFKNPELPVHLDIGSARGKFLIDLAEMHPTRNFIGIEIRNKLVEEANEIIKLSSSQVNGTANCMFICANLLSESHQSLLEESLSTLNVNRISILFPDPWIKNKHQARRVVQVPVVNSLAKILCKKGELIIASDVESVIQDARTKLLECTDNFKPVKSSANSDPASISSKDTSAVCDENNLPPMSSADSKNDQPLGEIAQGIKDLSEATIPDVEPCFELDEDGFVLSNPFKPLASEREQVCEMSWRKVFRLIYIRK